MDRSQSRFSGNFPVQVPSLKPSLADGSGFWSVFSGVGLLLFLRSAVLVFLLFPGKRSPGIAFLLLLKFLGISIPGIGSLKI